MAQKDGDLRKIEQLIKIMKKNDLVEVEIKHGEDKICLKRTQPQQPTVTTVPIISTHGTALSVGPDVAGPAPANNSTAASGPKDNLIDIKSPLVGTFYATPSPDSEPFVDIDSQVNPQIVVCIIEAMKVMNEIKAETSGTIADILVTNGQAVEYGQVLFRVKPD